MLDEAFCPDSGSPPSVLPRPPWKLSPPARWSCYFIFDPGSGSLSMTLPRPPRGLPPRPRALVLIPDLRPRQWQPILNLASAFRKGAPARLDSSSLAQAVAPHHLASASLEVAPAHPPGGLDSPSLAASWSSPPSSSRPQAVAPRPLWRLPPLAFVASPRCSQCFIFGP